MDRQEIDPRVMDSVGLNRTLGIELREVTPER